MGWNQFSELDNFVSFPEHFHLLFLDSWSQDIDFQSFIQIYDRKFTYLSLTTSTFVIFILNQGIIQHDHGLYLCEDGMLYLLQDFSFLFLGHWFNSNLHGKWAMSVILCVDLNWLAIFFILNLLHRFYFGVLNSCSWHYTNYTNISDRKSVV